MAALTNMFLNNVKKISKSILEGLPTHKRKLHSDNHQKSDSSPETDVIPFKMAKTTFVKSHSIVYEDEMLDRRIQPCMETKELGVYENNKKTNRYRKPTFTRVEYDQVAKWIPTVKASKMKRYQEQIGLTDPLQISNRMYMKKLYKIMMEEKIGGVKYSAALEVVVNGGNIDPRGKKADDELLRKFSENGIRYYTYILLDTKKLPNDRDPEQVTFSEFLNGIFYIGKGTNDRSISHLLEAQELTGERARRINLKSQEKLSHINEIWSEGGGIHVLEFGRHVCDQVAHVREACMIEAFRIRNLKNERAGRLILPSGWNKERAVLHGVYLLAKAHKVFQSNVAPAIRPVQINEDHYKGLAQDEHKKAQEGPLTQIC